MRVAIIFKFRQPKVGTSDVKKTCWWTGLQMVHYELLPTGQTITGDLYSQQLEHAQQALRQKEPSLVNRKGILFFHGNTRPHVVRVVRDTIQQLGWETLCHLLYSPDLVPIDYHLFHSLDNHLHGKSFTNETYLCQALANFFASKAPEYKRKGIEPAGDTLAEGAGCQWRLLWRLDISCIYC